VIDWRVAVSFAVGMLIYEFVKIVLVAIFVTKRKWQ